MLSWIIFGILVAAEAALECPDKWRGNIASNACYLFVAGEKNVTQPQAQAECLAQGAHLVGINSAEEEKFVITYASQGETYTFSDQPWIGLKRRGKNSWFWEDGTAPKIVHWAKGEPNNNNGNENCVKMNVVTVKDKNGKVVPFKGEMGNTNDTPCDRVSSRYICRKVMPDDCCDMNSFDKLDGCECNAGYTDIRNTDIPDGKLYNKSGSLCIPNKPCENDIEPQTMVFILDASDSVGQTGWENLMAFVEKAAPVISKNTRVHFITYSNVSAVVSLKETWTEADFKKTIPRQYTSGTKETAKAFDAATLLLKNDKNARKTVILMTDGEPTAPDAMPAALNALKAKGARLLTVGFGQNLDTSRTVFENWLENPSVDYYPYHQATSLYTSDHMNHILSNVCEQQRFA